MKKTTILISILILSLVPIVIAEETSYVNQFYNSLWKYNLLVIGNNKILNQKCYNSNYPIFTPITDDWNENAYAKGYFNLLWNIKKQELNRESLLKLSSRCSSGGGGSSYQETTSDSVEQIKSIYGDTNSDGIVDSKDWTTFSLNYGKTEVKGGASQGDFNGDGKVDSLDATTLALSR